MTARSNRREVRNPVLALPSAKALRNLPPEAKAALRAALGEIAGEAARKAQHSWATNKAPMAAYWKAVGVYAKHIRAVANKPGDDA
jgi:hypothetical protein